MRSLLIIIIVLSGLFIKAQESIVEFKKSPVYSLRYLVSPTAKSWTRIGYYSQRELLKLNKGVYVLNLKYELPEGDTVFAIKLNLNRDTILDLDSYLKDNALVLQSVDITNAGSVFSKNNLRQVEGFAIYAGKKTEVITISNTKANLATNNGRQVFAKIAGLNIWESDAGGIQLGIGGRGLSPNRTSNFNTRQNGYDISADALGYPESYYSPVPDMVERIEVVRGASSLQYGTQFGGLVNFKMKEAIQDNKIHASGKYTAGSFGFLNLTHQVSYGNNRFGIYVAHQFKKGNGYRDYTGFNNQSLFVNVFYKIKRRLVFGLDFTKMGYLAQQPGGLSDEIFNKDPFEVLRKRNWFTVNWNLGAAYMDFYVNENIKLNTRFFGLLSDRSNVGYLGQINRPDLGQPREVLAGEFKNGGNETRLLINYKILKSHQTFLVGTRMYKGQTTSKQGLAATNDGSDFSFLHPANIDYSNYLFPSTNFAAFTENIFRIKDKTTITPGVRYEWIDTRSNGYYYQRNFDLSGDTLLEIKYNSSTQNKRQLLLVGIGFSHKPARWLELFANVSQNYRAINFSDIAIVNPNFKVDPSMKDESGYTADAGLRGSFKNWLSFDISGFYLSYKNRIGEIFKVDDFSYNVIRYRTNIGNSYNYGLESFLEIDLIKVINDSSKWSLPVFVNYSFIQAFYSSTTDYAVAGNRVEFVPQQMLRTGMSLGYKNIFVSYNYSYLGEQFSDATNAIKTSNAIYGLIPAYWVMDASLGAKWKWIKGDFHVNNFTNNFYFTRRAAAYPGPGIIPAEIRSFYFSLSINF